MKTAQKKKTEQLTDEERSEREKIIWKIRRYLSSQRFGHYLTKEMGIKYTQNGLQKLKLPTLRNILARIRTAIDNQRAGAIYDRLLQGGLLGIEKAISPVYDIDGFSKNLLSDNGFLDAVEKAKIEAELPSIPPHLQIGIIATQCAVATHHLNQFKKVGKQQSLGSPTRDMNPPDEESILTDVKVSAEPENTNPVISVGRSL